MATVPYQHIRVIVNPAAGQNEPILNTLNEVFHRHELEWDVRITLGPGDATRLAREAVANGVDLVAGYGGDGTQMEIANGVMGSNTPMAILPGGTGNAMTFELKIPRNLKQAAELICQSGHRRKLYATDLYRTRRADRRQPRRERPLGVVSLSGSLPAGVEELDDSPLSAQFGWTRDRR
jgi:diacylglycerol kinase family enzyme